MRGWQNLVERRAPGDILGMDPSRRRFLAAGAGLAAAVAGGGLLRANQLETVRSTARRRVGDRLGLRVVLATDMHAPNVGFEPVDLGRAAGDFAADLLLISGDTLNRRGDEHLVSAYTAIPARYGKFAALGNWEYQGACDVVRLRREYERAGVRLLVNEAVTVDVRGERVMVTGLDDLLHGRPRLSLLAAGSPRADRSLVMAHCPALFDEVGRQNLVPQIVFSGHTHGGQIVPFGRVVMTPAGSGAFVNGWYEAPGGDHQLYVSRGLGNSRIPLRIGARPEIALLTL